MKPYPDATYAGEFGKANVHETTTDRTPVSPAILAAANEAEENCLTTAFRNRKAARRLVATLQPSDFYSPGRARLFGAIRGLVAEGLDVDPVILADRLAGAPWFAEMGGPAYLHTLTDLPAFANNVDEYAAIVKRQAARRRTDRIGQRLAAGEINAAEAIAALQDVVDDAGPDQAPATPFVDWAEFWQRDTDDADWVFEDVLARGRGHAIYAPHKTMKSLFALYVAAQCATSTDQTVVVYLDYEMGEEDLSDRLENMGYGAEHDLSRLKYALLPSLPPLDTPDGARALAAMLDAVQAEWPGYHLMVIIDTIGRAISGEENSSDTFRAFYAHTGMELKRRRVTWVRLDHAGKDPARGQRGTSGKGDDVDVVWRVERTQNGICLHRDLARMPWVPERVTFGLTEDPLCYRRLVGDWPSGTHETAIVLDRLEIPLNASTRAAQTALKDAGEGRRKQVIVAALKWRRERSDVTP